MSDSDKQVCFVYRLDIQCIMYEYIETISKNFDIVESKDYDDPNIIFAHIQDIPSELTESQIEHSFLINIEQMTNWHFDRVISYNPDIRIIDYSQANIHILVSNGKLRNKIFYVPYCPNDSEIFNYEKIYDCCIIDPDTSRRLECINKIPNMDIITGWGRERDEKLFRYKILVNIHKHLDWKIYEEIRCSRCTFNKMIVITEKSLPDPNYPLKDHIIECDYDDIPAMVKEVLNNYEFYYNKLFGNFDIEKVKADYVRITDNIITDL